MTSPYDRLGISPTATPDEVKAAYHAKLKEFPAHRNPEEFKAIRAAYEEIRKRGTSAGHDFFFMARPLEMTLDPEVVDQLRHRIVAQLELSLDELIQETF